LTYGNVESLIPCSGTTGPATMWSYSTLPSGSTSLHNYAPLSFKSFLVYKVINEKKNKKKQQIPNRMNNVKHG
jgi:hypothetical protein